MSVVTISPTSGARLYDQTVEQLGRSIVQGALGVGETILPDQLAEDLGLSRSVLREAFRALESKGLVQARPRIGTRVAPRDQWNFLDPQVITWRLQGEDRLEQVEELYSTRLAVEPVAAQLIAGLSDGAAVRDLRRLIARMREAMVARDLHAFTEADVEFHTELLHRSGNKMFSCFSTVIAAAVRTRETLVFPLVEETHKGLQMHERLVEQIAAADPDVETTARTLIRDAHSEARTALGHWDHRGAHS